MPGWEQFVDIIKSLLTFLHTGLGSWGGAIILFTVAIKVITWPLTSKQLQSSKAMQELQPKMKALQEKYKDDKEKQTQETMKLYQETGVNPLMGCLPMLIQFPIWIGLYRAILSLANDDKVLDTPFLFLPSLACPGSAESAEICKAAIGMAWPLDFANLGSTWPYLVLPVLTMVSQIGVSRLMSPTAAPTAQDKGKQEDPTQAMMKQMTTIMPLMFGFFAIQFPSGLALYWVTNNMLTFVQYFVINQQKKNPPMALASAALADGPIIIDVEAKPKPKKVNSKKDKTDGGKANRKRKKRRS